MQSALKQQNGTALTRPEDRLRATRAGIAPDPVPLLVPILFEEPLHLSVVAHLLKGRNDDIFVDITLLLREIIETSPVSDNLLCNPVCWRALFDPSLAKQVIKQLAQLIIYVVIESHFVSPKENGETIPVKW